MSKDKPWDRRIPENTPPGTVSGMPVKIPDECPVCGEFTFAGWRTLHGEARCKCGAIFQIKPTSKGDWDDVPRCKVLEKFIPLMKRYWEEESDKRMVIEDKLDRFVREHEDEVDDK